jgi:ketosteroid isomerase-like protein
LNTESDALRSVRKVYDAFNRGDFDAAVAEMHPEIEWERAEQAPDTTPLKGADAIRAWMMPDVFEEQHVTLEEVVESGDKVFVQILARVKARGSGIEISDRAFHVWTIRDGKAARFEFFQDRTEALAAAGLDD